MLLQPLLTLWIALIRGMTLLLAYAEWLHPHLYIKNPCFLWKLKHPEEEKGKQEDLSDSA